MCVTLLAVVPNPTLAQDKGQQPSDPLMKFVESIDQAVDEEVTRYYKTGGKIGTSEHPARRWAAVLLEFSETHRGTLAATEAIRRAMWMLQHAGLNNEMFRLADKIPLCDAAWTTILEPLSYAADGSDRENLLIQKTVTLQANCADPAVRATATYTRGILHHRRSEIGKAKAALGETLQENTDTPAIKKADRLLFEISSLNVGQTVPTFSAKSTNNKLIRPEDFRGKVVLLNFWSST
jgi:hypothetical protein